MNTFTITDDYDEEYDMYLSTSINGPNLQLCITEKWSAMHLHLTSDPKYMEWLIKHHKSLFIIDENSWYESGHPRYYKEFKYTMSELIKWSENHY